MSNAEAKKNPIHKQYKASVKQNKESRKREIKTQYL